MASTIIRDFKVLSLPATGEPNSRYWVEVENSDKALLYITTDDGEFRLVAPEDAVYSAADSPIKIEDEWGGTQDEYDALTPNANTLYFIVEENL